MNMKPGRLQGKVAIVTGASGGIGLSIAQEFAAEGAAVMLTDTNELDGSRVERELARSGSKVKFVKHNVSIEEDWESVFADAKNMFGPVSILVNNAGVSPSGQRIENMDISVWRDSLNVNLDGSFLGIKHGIRNMQTSESASIICISSICGLVALPDQAEYGAAKGGMTILSKVAAIECSQRDYPIRVNTIHPGFVDTKMFRSALSGGNNSPEDAKRIDQKYERFSAALPMKRYGKVTEIAKTATFLASNESSYITGTQIVVDGGYTAT